VANITPAILHDEDHLKTVAKVFTSDGLLSRDVPDFVERTQQIDMATAVAKAITGQTNALIEAGTGTGKTFAYLVPILLQGKKAIISTGTKTLQDQLFYQDLPTVLKLLGLAKRVSLLKGRNNYLCPERLEKNIKVMTSKSNAKLLSRLVTVRQWSQMSRTGDLNELSDEDSGPVSGLITSTTDNCLGGECPSVAVCPLYRAREKAAGAELVVVNHHLLLADLAMKEESIARLLPEVEVIVIDEAHQISAVARHFFGETVTSGQLKELARDIVRELQVLGNDNPALHSAAQELEVSVSQLLRVFNASEQNNIKDLLMMTQVRDSIDELDLTLSTLSELLEASAIRSKVFQQCFNRCLRLMDKFAVLTEPIEIESEYAHWIERQEKSFVLRLSPVSIVDSLAPHFFAEQKSWIFTSATLTVAEKFDHVRSILGLKGVIEYRFDSPFDFNEQVRGLVPGGLPVPGARNHTEALIKYCLPIIKANRGRSFILFTSYRALHAAHQVIAESGGVSYLVQGTMSRQQLLDKFKTIPRCVLLATQSFWEGIDVKGADLRCVIIDKLPFTSPEDPLHAAQLRLAAAKGENGFQSISIPEAAISLKQGFGRLIRQENDRGLFVLGDNRILTKNYGGKFFRSLPEMSWLDSQTQAIEYIASLD
jgi:ATP-dependent DNA helicase DinG